MTNNDTAIVSGNSLTSGNVALQSSDDNSGVGLILDLCFRPNARFLSVMSGDVLMHFAMRKSYS